MSNILESITKLLQSAIEGAPGDPRPPVILDGLSDPLNRLLEVRIDPSGDGIDNWLTNLRDIIGDIQPRETLLVRALQMHFPRLAETLTLLGIIGVEWEGTVPGTFSIKWQQLNDLLAQPGEKALSLLFSRVQSVKDLKALQVLGLLLISAPKELLSLEYRQQGFLSLPLDSVPGINSDELLGLLGLVNSPLRLPLPFAPFALPLTLDQFKWIARNAADGDDDSITLDAWDPPVRLMIELHLKNAADAIKKTIDLGNGWRLSFGGADTGDKRYGLQVGEAGIDVSNASVGDFSILVEKTPSDGNALLLGELNGTHFAIKSIRFGLRLRARQEPPVDEPLFDIVLHLSQIEFALKPDFLKFLSFGLNLPTLLHFDSHVALTYTQGKGLSGQGSADGFSTLNTQFATPLNLKIGGAGAGLNIDQVVTQIEIALLADTLRFRVRFRYGANAQFGPLSAVMDGAGAWIGRWVDGNGGLLPPQGIGLSLNAPPVVGGGFLKLINDNEFAGAMQLKILGIGAFAYGLYKTLPNGAPSFVALIGIRLPLPGIQLGFGFAVSGFGGLVGINRRADTDMLRERLSSGAAGDVLFNDDPMRNAPRLLGDMQQFFPAENGVFLIGPTLQINWLYILKLDAGVFIELPTGKPFITGSARLVIGSEEFALVYLRMDFIGGIDFTKSLIFFDAALVNSHVLGIFRITGGVALRIYYGENGYFLFTVGGFHPSFNPGPMELPRVARVGASVSLGPVWLKQEMYLAITSNTFQLGARTEAGIKIGPISAHGWFGFDALIQLRPFYFVASINAGFDVEVKGVSLCNVRVEGQLSGPGPLVLAARASVRLLFIKVSGDVTITLNDNPPEAVVTIPNLAKHLEKELSNPHNLRIEGEDHSVIFAPQSQPSDKTSQSQTPEKLFAPVGQLVWEQKRVPLDLPIEKAEGVQLGGWHHLTVTGALGHNAPEQHTPEFDWFSVGAYLNLNDSQALNNGRFAQQQSGIRIKTAAMEMDHGDTEDAFIKIKLVKLPRRIWLKGLFEIKQYVFADLAGVLGERVNGARMPTITAVVTVEQEHWNHWDSKGEIQNKKSPLSPTQAFVNSKRQGGIALPTTEKALRLTGVF